MKKTHPWRDDKFIPARDVVETVKHLQHTTLVTFKHSDHHHLGDIVLLVDRKTFFTIIAITEKGFYLRTSKGHMNIEPGAEVFTVGMTP